MIPESWVLYQVDEDDTRGKDYAVWAVVADEVATEGNALSTLRSAYEHDPRPMRIVRITYEVIVDIAPDPNGGVRIHMTNDAKETVHQTVEALSAMFPSRGAITE